MTDKDSGRLPAAPGSSPSGRAADRVSPVPATIPSAADRLTTYRDAQGAHGAYVSAMFAEKGSNRIVCTEGQWAEMERLSDMESSARIALIPTERDAIDLMHTCYTRLKELGWNDPVYCPKDGSTFDMIEAGSTGIHKGSYEGEWPHGSWWIHEEGDFSPTRPVLYRVTEAEIARREEFRRAVHDSAAPKGDAQPSPPTPGEQ